MLAMSPNAEVLESVRSSETRQSGRMQRSVGSAISALRGSSACVLPGASPCTATCK